ncbi:reverse transcriptase domain-containing protein [Tanacetum coccineum]
MNERCSAVLLNKFPSKEKDPRSFTIPCDIGHLHINNALADLGASISLMPYTMYEKLGLGEPKPTRMSLELADISIQYPRGIVEDALIKTDKFVLPIDFVILDMREDSRIPIILGRPFLATARAMIDVFNKKITLRVGSEEVIFAVDQSMKKPRTEDDECYRIDDLDTVIQFANQELLENDQLYENLEEDIGAENLAADHLSRLENPNIGELAEEEIEDKFPDEHLMILKTKLNDEEPWYADYVNYIVEKVVPPEWTPKKKKRFFSQVKNYFWDEPYAFRLCPGNVMRRCVTGSEILEILAHCHSGPTRGHHSASVTGRNVYEAGFYWPSIFRDAKDYVMK